MAFDGISHAESQELRCFWRVSGRIHTRPANEPPVAEVRISLASTLIETPLQAPLPRLAQIAATELFIGGQISKTPAATHGETERIDAWIRIGHAEVRVVDEICAG